MLLLQLQLHPSSSCSCSYIPGSAYTLPRGPPVASCCQLQLVCELHQVPKQRQWATAIAAAAAAADATAAGIDASSGQNGGGLRIQHPLQPVLPRETPWPA